ncbi:MAG: DUF1284 domain-containing protein [Candidatus Omnitrophica bacterium]|nr:DUF1284 domain-containing protein [Candidatus Omnitrophota bacterium]
MIKKGHEFRVNLVIGEDDICLFCPHLSNSNCLKKPDSEIVLQKKEQKIVSLLNVDTSDTVILSVLYEKMREKFTLNMLDNLCSDCQWYSMGDCKKGFKNLKKGGFL